MNKTGIAIGASAITFILCLSVNHFAPEHKTMTKIHKLEYPLILSSESASKNTHMLPKGTVLYFDKSYPEGFTRYKIYINIDRMPLKLDDLSDPTEIDPIDAVAPSKEDLLKLLRDYPLTKSDLESILNSKRISKDEIREILDNFIR
uniref:Putative transmembrane protein n=1 Tax=Dechloromonas aromatica (strain RCB) TaxID=159087 RepID=Q47E08_DECAR